jgi:hypothetical protein
MSTPIYLDIETPNFFGDAELAGLPREAQLLAIEFGFAVTWGLPQPPLGEPLADGAQRADAFRVWRDDVGVDPAPAGHAAELWDQLLAASLVVGWNIQSFDLPILFREYIKRVGDVAPRWPRTLDLMDEIKAATGRWYKLDDIARANLGRGKTADGKQAAGWLRSGELDRAIAYCQEDVQIVRELHAAIVAGGSLVLPPQPRYKQDQQLRIWFDAAGRWTRYEVQR